MELPYKIRYAKVKPRHVVNLLRPSAFFLDEWNNKNSFYENLEQSIIKEGIRNPILVIAVRPIPFDNYTPQMKKRYRYYQAGTKHYRFSRKSLPPEYANGNKELIACATHGGSRLFYAQKHNVMIPALIMDFIDKFRRMKTIHNKDDIFKYFKDKPDEIILSETGIKIRNLPHSHLSKEES